ncbi:hypothetical protein ADUPG1_010178 [Aduncisulcus paluster]|uniref:EGF-like domain-containing protein n=1 Tax=Aduncisulcus paluster TaxID=2918883 RepID=A0ABQ5JQU3_9EUKA|nr:hypothetical protein ADUPG1_010178 [Aduncisulcus paluster]
MENQCDILETDANSLTSLSMAEGSCSISSVDGIEHFSNLNEIVVSNFTDSLEFLSTLPNLDYLVFSSIDYSQDFSFLSSLTISSVQFDDYSVNSASLSAIFVYLPSTITYIGLNFTFGVENLSFLSELSSPGTVQTFRILSAYQVVDYSPINILTNLSELFISGASNYVGFDTHLVDIFANISSSLTSLSLIAIPTTLDLSTFTSCYLESFVGISVSFLNGDASPLANCTSLTKLSIESDDLDLSTLNVDNLYSLETLSIRASDDNSSGFTADYLYLLPNFQELYLDTVEIASSFYQWFRISPDIFPALVSIDISGTDIESLDGFTMVTSDSFPLLESVNIDHANISNPQPLIDAYLPSLRRVGLQSNYVCNDYSSPEEFSALFDQYQDGTGDFQAVVLNQRCNCGNYTWDDDGAFCMDTYFYSYDVGCDLGGIKSFSSLEDAQSHAQTFTCVESIGGNTCLTSDAYPIVIDGIGNRPSAGGCSEYHECISIAGGEPYCACIEGWYGAACDKECPVILDENDYEVMCSDDSACLQLMHTCLCPDFTTGDACQYVDFVDENLPIYLCDETLQSQSKYMGFVDNEPFECTEDGNILITDMAKLLFLNLENSNVTDLTGLLFATSLTSLMMDSINLTEDAASSIDLSEFTTMTELESLTISSSSNFSISTESILNLPASLVSLRFTNDQVGEDVDFSPLENLVLLDLADNSDFNLTLVNLLPDSLESLDVANTSFSLPIPGILPQYIRSLNLMGTPVEFPSSFDNMTQNDGSQLPNLISLSISETSISSFTGLPSTISTLTAASCPGLSLLSLTNTSALSAVVQLDLSNNNISDPSPLYFMENLENINLSQNSICGSDVSSLLLLDKFISDDIEIEVEDNLCPQCDGSTCLACLTLENTSISENKVCVETYFGSGSYQSVCASDSFVEYTSLNTFTCTQPLCDGGNSYCCAACPYGQECRFSSVSGESSCVDIIPDDDLHSSIANLLDDSDQDITNGLFSVASLKSLVSSTDEQDNVAPILDCTGSNVSDLTGIEHLQGISEVYLDECPLNASSNLSNLSVLFGLEKLSMNSIEANTELPDLSDLELLTWFDIHNSSFSIPGDAYVLPSSLLYINLNGSSIDQSGFDWNIAERLQYLLTLNIGSTVVTDISKLSLLQRQSIRVLDVSYLDLGTDSISVIESMNHLISITLDGCTNITTIPDLSESYDSLLNLSIAFNPSLTTLYPLFQYGLSNLTSIDVSSSFISDISPLFDMPALLSIAANNTAVCVGSSSPEDYYLYFVNGSETDFVLYMDPLSCNCEDSLSSIPISDFKVCSETKPGSNTWYPVCSSHSIASYTSVDTFECLAPLNTDGETYGCSGGCEYGYECRYDDETQASSSCYHVIADTNLRAHVTNLISDSHRVSSQGEYLVNAASLKHYSGTEIYFSGYELESDELVNDLTGLEYMSSLTSINMSSHSFSSCDPIKYLPSVSSLILGHNANLSDISCVCPYQSLVTLDISASPVLELPSSCSFSPFSSVTSLGISDTLIADLSVLLDDNDENNTLTRLSLASTDLYTYSGEFEAYIDISQLLSFSSIEDLDISGLELSESSLQNLLHLSLRYLTIADNLLYDISPLYQLNQSLIYLDISENNICNANSEQYSSYLPSTSIILNNQNETDCDNCTVSVTLDDGTVIHASESSDSGSISANTVCRAVWDWTETDEMTMESTLHQYWNVECNLYSYLAEDGTCISYINSVTSAPASSFPLCVEERMDHITKMCDNSAGDSTTCIDGWYGSECIDECPTDSDGFVCGNNGTCQYDSRACECDDSHQGSYCQYVLFDDSDLEAFICDNIEGLTCSVDGHMLFEDLESVTELDLSGQTDITSIGGIEYAVNLISLSLSSISLSDSTNVTELCELTSLENLDLSNSNISSIGCSIDSISTLDISYSELTSLSAFSQCNLDSLKMDGVSLDDITIVESFTELVTLEMSYVSIFDDDTDINDPQVHSLSSTDLSLIEWNVFESLSYLVASNNNIDSLLWLVYPYVTEFHSLDLSYNSIRDPTPLYLLGTSLCIADLSYNYICGSDTSESYTYFSSHFLDVECLETEYIFSDQFECPCSSSSFSFESNLVCSVGWIDESESSVYLASCSAYSYKVMDSSTDVGFVCVEFGSDDDESGDPEIVEECLLQCSTQGHFECVDIMSYSTLSTSVSVECVCDEGWYGEECSRECPVVISDVDSLEYLCGAIDDSVTQGSCNLSSHSCECTLGWGSDNCSEDQCAMTSEEGVCNNHGTCYQLSSSSSYCSCEQGYGGDSCVDKTCDDSSGEFCSGVGICEKDSYGEYHCSACDSAYTLNYDASDCLPMCSPVSYCGDYGTCVGSNECVCDDGYSNNPEDASAPCSIYTCGDDASNPCSGSDHGICTRISFTEHECSCNLGWNGDSCELEGCPMIDDGSGSFISSCGDHGSCVMSELDGTSACECEIGWELGLESLMCDSMKGTCVDDASCSDQGICSLDSDLEEWNCECFSGWGGESCSIDECSATCDTLHSTGCEDILGDGSLSCACKQGWIGEMCSISDCDCHGKGECVDDSSNPGASICECIGGWSGNTCDAIQNDYDSICFDTFCVPFTTWTSLFPLVPSRSSSNIIRGHGISIFSSSTHPIDYSYMSFPFVEAVLDPLLTEFLEEGSQVIADGSVFSLESDECQIIFCSDSITSISEDTQSIISLDQVMCKTFSLSECSFESNSVELKSFTHSAMSVIHGVNKRNCQDTACDVTFPVFSSIDHSSVRLFPQYALPECNSSSHLLVIRIFGDSLAQCIRIEDGEDDSVYYEWSRMESTGLFDMGDNYSSEITSSSSSRVGNIAQQEFYLKSYEIALLCRGLRAVLE